MLDLRQNSLGPGPRNPDHQHQLSSVVTCLLFVFITIGILVVPAKLMLRIILVWKFRIHEVEALGFRPRDARIRVNEKLFPAMTVPETAVARVKGLQVILGG